MSKFLKISIIFSCFLILSECGIYKPVDTRKTPISGKERARKNVEEGRGISLKGLATGRGKTTYQFSTSNPMWRATLDILDFLPLSTVDYSGGVIISDWYSDQTILPTVNTVEVGATPVSFGVPNISPLPDAA